MFSNTCSGVSITFWLTNFIKMITFTTVGAMQIAPIYNLETKSQFLSHNNENIAENISLPTNMSKILFPDIKNIFTYLPFFTLDKLVFCVIFIHR